MDHLQPPKPPALYPGLKWTLTIALLCAVGCLFLPVIVCIVVMLIYVAVFYGLGMIFTHRHARERTGMLAKLGMSLVASVPTGVCIGGITGVAGMLLDEMLMRAGIWNIYIVPSVLEPCSLAGIGLLLGLINGTVFGICWAQRENPLARTIFTLTRHTRWVGAAGFSNDGRVLATGSYDETIRVWELGTGNERLTIEGQQGGVTNVLFAPDGRTFASANDHTIHIWDAETGQQLQRLEGHTGRVWAVAYSPTGDAITSVGADATIRQWEAATGRELWQRQGHQDGTSPVSVHAVACTPDGRKLASGGRDATVRVWDAATGAELKSLAGHSGDVVSLAFSPDSALLATGGDDQQVRIWDVRTGQLSRTLYGHTGSISSLAFSPDGLTLASGSEDRTARLWRLLGIHEPITLTGHQGGVACVCFSPDGTLLATASGDTTVRVWALDL